MAAKTVVFAVLRSTPLRYRNKATHAKLSTPFRLEVTTVLAKRYGDRKHVLKALIVEFAVAYGYNSSSIWWIGAMFRPQNSEP